MKIRPLHDRLLVERLESRPRPLHCPAPPWRQSSDIEILARIPSKRIPRAGGAALGTTGS